MERRTGFQLAAVFFFSLFFSPSLKAIDTQYTSWGEVLKTYIAPDGNFRYQALKDDINKKAHAHSFIVALKEFEGVKKAEYDAWPREQQAAFLINAYNLLAIRLVATHYPVKSIKDIGGLFTSAFSTKFFKLLDGELTTLDSIQEGRLQAKFGDPRIYFALCTTAKSSPGLATEPYRAETLSAQLDDAVKIFLADKRQNRFTAKSGSLYLSKIFEWYEDELDAKMGGILKTIEKYGPDEARTAIKNGAKMKYSRFDWNLNDINRNSHLVVQTTVPEPRPSLSPSVTPTPSFHPSPSQSGIPSPTPNPTPTPSPGPTPTPGDSY